MSTYVNKYNKLVKAMKRMEGDAPPLSLPAAPPRRDLYAERLASFDWNGLEAPDRLPEDQGEAAVLLRNCMLMLSAPQGPPEILCACLSRLVEFCDHVPYMWPMTFRLWLLTFSDSHSFALGEALSTCEYTAFRVVGRDVVPAALAYRKDLEAYASPASRLSLELLARMKDSLLNGKGRPTEQLYKQCPLLARLLSGGSVEDADEERDDEDAEHLLKTAMATVGHVRKRSLSDRWGALLSEVPPEPDPSVPGKPPSWRDDYRKLTKHGNAGVKWRDQNSDLLFGLYLRWHYRNSAGFALGANSGRDITKLCVLYPSLLPYVMSREAEPPEPAAFDAYANYWGPRYGEMPDGLRQQATGHGSASQPLPVRLGISPRAWVDWSGKNPEDPAIRWVLAGLPGLGSGVAVEDGRLMLRTSDWADVEDLVQTVDALSNRKVLEFRGHADMAVLTGPVGPEGWEAYLDALAHACRVLSGRFPWFVGCDVERYRGWRRVAAMTVGQREALSQGCSVDPSLEFAKGGLGFRGLPVGENRSCSAMRMLVDVACLVRSGKVDDRPYLLPSTGVLRLGIGLGALTLVACETAFALAPKDAGVQPDLRAGVPAAPPPNGTLLSGDKNVMVNAFGRAVQGVTGMQGLQQSYGVTGVQGYAGNYGITGNRGLTGVQGSYDITGIDTHPTLKGRGFLDPGRNLPTDALS